MRRSWFFLSSFLLFYFERAQGVHQTETYHPLRIYSQNAETGYEAAGRLSLFFSVSLHIEDEQDHRDLLETAHETQAPGSILLILDSSSKIFEKELWNGVVVLDITANMQFTAQGNRSTVVGGEKFGWLKYGEELHELLTVPPVEEEEPKTSWIEVLWSILVVVVLTAHSFSTPISSISQDESEFSSSDTPSPPPNTITPALTSDSSSSSTSETPAPTGKDVVEIVTDPPRPPGESEDFKEPITGEQFMSYLSEVGKLAIDYYDNPAQHRVTTADMPGFLFQKFEREAPEVPEAFSKLLEFLRAEIMPGLTHWQHPRFFAYFVTGRSYPDMLADLLISSIGVVGFSWDSCPALTEMEHAMINWLGRALGIPESHLFSDDPWTSKGGGALFESASEAVYCSMLSARQWKISQLTGGDFHEDEIHEIHEKCQKLVYYASAEAHSAMEKGCKMALVRCRKIAPTRENGWGITGDQLEEEIQKDLKQGLVPAYVYVTIGTTSTADKDHLESICDVAKKHDMYVHVDAAYAGTFWLDPKHRCKGLEDVNSLNVNLHKALLHSAMTSAFFCRDKNIHIKAFTCTPIYLTPSRKNAIDYRDWGINLSRRFKGLKTWLVMSMYGLEELRRYLQRLIDNAQHFMELVETHPNCRIFGSRNYSLFTFQYVEEGMSPEEINAATTALCRYMNKSTEAFFTHTTVGGQGGHNLIRVSIGFERGTQKTYNECWEIVKGLIDKFREDRENNMNS